MSALVERLRGEVDEKHARPLPATAGASRHHDQRVGSHPARCGEIHQEGDGSVRQQHHLCALPVSQPAGENGVLLKVHHVANSRTPEEGLTFLCN